MFNSMIVLQLASLRALRAQVRLLQGPLFSGFT